MQRKNQLQITRYCCEENIYKSETESLLMATQYNVIIKNSVKTRTQKYNKRRLYGNKDDSIIRIISEYIRRITKSSEKEVRLRIEDITETLQRKLIDVHRKQKLLRIKSFKFPEISICLV